MLVYVNPSALTPFAGSEPVAGRREGVRRFLLTGKPVQAPRVALGEDGTADFIDGRHRFAELAAQGIDRIAITIPQRQLRAFRERYGAFKARGPKQRPAYEHFVEPETGELLSPAEIAGEAPERRAERMAKVRREIAEREAAIRQVQTFGFVPLPRSR